jgi:hypothetical protein
MALQTEAPISARELRSGVLLKGDFSPESLVSHKLTSVGDISPESLMSYHEALGDFSPDTLVSHKSTSIGDFSQATPSAYAMSAGTAFEIISRQTMQEMEAQEFGAKLAGLEGDLAKYLGQAMENSTHEEANATRMQGFAQIGQGVTTIAFEIVPVTRLYKNKEYNEQDAKTKELNNVKSHEEGIRQLENENKGNIGVRSVGKDAGRDDDAIYSQKVKNINTKKEYNEKALLDDLATARQRKLAAYDEHKEDIRTQKKALQKELSNIESDISSFKSKVQNMARSLSEVVGGGVTIGAAEARDAKAKAENIQQQATFANDSARRLIDANNKYADAMESQKQSAIRALLEGLADSNRV